MKTRFWGLIAFSAMLAAVAFVQPAKASSVTPYSLYMLLYDNSGLEAQQNLAAPINNTLSDSVSNATVTGIVQPSPKLTATASVSTANAQAESNVVLEYYFMIVPVTGTGTAPVSVNIAASGGVTASNLGADNIAYLQFANTGTILGSACSGNSPCTASGFANQLSFSIATTEQLTVGIQYALVLQARVSAQLQSGVGTAFASAYVDPILSFENSIDASQYQFDFSEGVGNSATPLPAALPLFATGLGGLGLFAWRRKRKAQAAAA